MRRSFNLAGGEPFDRGRARQGKTCMGVVLGMVIFWLHKKHDIWNIAVENLRNVKSFTRCTASLKDLGWKVVNSAMRGSDTFRGADGYGGGDLGHSSGKIRQVFFEGDMITHFPTHVVQLSERWPNVTQQDFLEIVSVDFCWVPLIGNGGT